MVDFLAAIGLVLVIEGIAFLAVPEFVKRMSAQTSEASPDLLRIVGLCAALAGLLIVWAVRTFLA